MSIDIDRPKHWTDPYRQLIADIRKRVQDRRYECSEKEEGFLASIEEQLNESSPLTDKQTVWLDAIWFKATERG